MLIARSAAELAPFAGGSFVPTMGSLHAGHASLVERARSAAPDAPVVVSVFVNPAQFDEATDFEAYPRDLERDAAVCERLGAACVFAPPVGAIYPEGAARGVPTADLPEVGRGPGLEDRFRPGHFEGVYAVCDRLFRMVRPARAVFGEKDWQQLRLVAALVEREGLGIEIVGAPTVREPDGLALSSRNARLSAEERARAGAIPRAIEAARAERDAAGAERAGVLELERAGLDAEYLAVRDGASLGPVRPGRPARVLVAARTPAVRLIDNAPWPA